MKGREDMFKLLQNEYEEYQEYFNELELIQRQYNQEEAYYFIINKLIRDSINDKDISVRDVHKVSTLTGENANKLSGRNKYLKGYDGQAPDFVILHNDFEESKGEGQVYGCVEIKPFSLENKKLYRNYIHLIKEQLLEEEKKSFQLVHEKSCQNRIKIEFESSEKKKEFIEKYLQGKKGPIPISLENEGIKGKVFLCGGNKELCLQIEENQSIEFKDNEIKPLKIQMQNDKVVLVPRTRKSENMEREYLVELKSKKIKEEKFSQENKECCNTIVCELLKELIGFKKVIFTNGYQWILIQCSETEFEKEKDKNGIKLTSPITVKDFQCKSLANFYPEPKDEETFNRLISSWEETTQCEMISSCKKNTKKNTQCEIARETIEKFDGSWGELGFNEDWSGFKKNDCKDIKRAIKNCYLKEFLNDKDINKVRSNLDKFELWSVSRYLDLGLHLTEFQTVEDFKAWTDMTFDELRLYNFEQWLHLKFGIKGIFKEAKSKQREEKSENDE